MGLPLDFNVIMHVLIKIESQMICTFRTLSYPFPRAHAILGMHKLILSRILGLLQGVIGAIITAEKEGGKLSLPKLQVEFFCGF